ncbi:stage V sporulation protein C (peptidyl-tRNA hydrolase (PTH)) [Oceanobacillus iheyensis HTE831]|uniref:Peptidyl-tRNA hydrolase n=1 Tax=Oceanobacillus iheyensis (strain DSM 14371 / CIP 107618 / JCM 11309 / KCTC 3954 / HTE831) TaxID=221109 RepID=PTH_OCEIH|nr:aminoacyl-tRNA hydrolase [Oceanobacillus iheyensis]Q8CXP8.1 RecName: Full=Peptidyl-tRNA hydrolase; Short=PTH [Oceanobacillus iheyensis HTE831]BAC12017.1 stage V sporulation protein C (peptidyl-tRNA hydrolase (PTH)) [Oceanobacillus iheyensis HTE831]
MKLIVGLGNPGRKFKKTRHNIGFFVIDELLQRHKWKLNNSKFEGDYSIEHFDGEKVILLQPQTYMNLSGKSISPLMDYFDIDVDDVIVVYDDLDLPTGKIRLRQKGGHGGHNGVRSTIDHLGTKDFKRVRLGIGRPTNATPVIDYVLGKFPKQETTAVTDSVEKAADAIEAWIKGKPFLEVMNDFNQ